VTFPLALAFFLHQLRIRRLLRELIVFFFFPLGFINPKYPFLFRFFLTDVSVSSFPTLCDFFFCVEIDRWSFSVLFFLFSPGFFSFLFFRCRASCRTSFLEDQILASDSWLFFFFPLFARVFPTTPQCVAPFFSQIKSPCWLGLVPLTK